MMTLARPHLVGWPVLETERLNPPRPQAADWPVFGYYPASARTVYAGGVKTEDEAAQQFASFFGHWFVRGFGRLIAEERATGQPVRHFGPMQWHDGAQPKLTWSLWTAEAEGRGFATGVLKLLLLFSFIEATNARSKALAERLGAKPERDVIFDGTAPTVYRHPASAVAA